jgi:hypothetical protein
MPLQGPADNEGLAGGLDAASCQLPGGWPAGFHAAIRRQLKKGTKDPYLIASAKLLPIFKLIRSSLIRHMLGGESRTEKANRDLSKVNFACCGVTIAAGH